MASPGRILYNSIGSFIYNLVSKSANVVAFIVLARLGGSEQAGIFSLGTTYLVIFTATAWGLDEYLIRQVARDRSRASEYFGSFLLVRLLFSLASYGLMAALVGKIIGYSPSTTVPLLILGISIIPEGLANVAQALMSAREHFVTPALAALLSTLLKIAGLIAALTGGLGLNGVGWAWVVGSIMGMVILLVVSLRSGLSLGLDLLRNKNFRQEAPAQIMPFLGIGFLLTLEYQADVVILSLAKDEQVVGWYGAVTTVVFALTLLSQGFRAAIYPLMASSSVSNPPLLTRIYQRSIFYLGAAAFPIAAGLTLCSQKIIELIFGPSFLPATIPLQIMSWMLVFTYMNIPNARMLLVSDRQHILWRLLLISMITNFLLNLLLDPWISAAGAALARVVSSALIFFTSLGYLSKERLVIFSLKPLLPVLLATGVMLAALWPIHTASLWIVIPAGIFLYTAMVLLLRGHRHQ